MLDHFWGFWHDSSLNQNKQIGQWHASEAGYLCMASKMFEETMGSAAQPEARGEVDIFKSHRADRSAHAPCNVDAD